MKIIAHRGAPKYAPENTIESFLYAASAGAKIFEFDVHLTKDGHLVVCHDETLLRTAGADVEIKTSVLEELLKYDVGNGQKLPLLDETLTAIGKENLLNVEIKTDVVNYPGIEKLVLDTVYKTGFERSVIISSFNYETLLNTRALDGEIPLGYLTRNFDPQFAKQINAKTVNMNYKRLTPDIIETAHSLGLEVWAYTVNNYEDFKIMEEAGVDAVFTDDPRVNQIKAP